MALPIQLGLYELRSLLGGAFEVWGNPPAPTLTRLVGFEKAEWECLSVLPDRATPTKIAQCRAGVAVGSAVQYPDWVRGRANLDEPGWFLRVDDTARAFLRLLEGPCRPLDDQDDWLGADEVVAQWGSHARTAMVHRAAKIGAGTWLGAGAVVGPRVEIGAGCRIGEGTVIGSPGFGFAPIDGRAVAFPHWAGVHLEADVWVGPQCQIAAGILEPTWIGTGVRLDAQVQVAHNCRIGAHCLIAGQSGLAGSVELGERCLVGGQVGFSDHVVVGPGCRVAARAGVTKSWPGGVVLHGFPARTRSGG